jgi:hypothetical protein
MATIWGRTLVNLAEEVLRRYKDSIADGKPPQAPTPEPEFIVAPPGTWRMPTELPKAPSTNPDEPTWPPSSVFSIIASRRPPIPTLIDLGSTTPHELMLLAQDQFSRGIFHMPHPLHQSQLRNRYANAPLSTAVSSSFAPFTFTPPFSKLKRTAAEASSSTATPTPNTDGDNGEGNDTVNKNLLPLETFSRAKELYTIALEVFVLAEKLEVASERATWASWADSVFSQMKMEADMDAWRASITSARGRCHLIVGSALAETVEAILAGEGEENEDVWDCEDARDARDALVKAIAFLEKAREAVVEDRMETEDITGDHPAAAIAEIADGNEDGDEEILIIETDEKADLSGLLAEALLTLANLTKDKTEREALYSRAQKEGGDAVTIELDNDDEDDEDRMDESV